MRRVIFALLLVVGCKAEREERAESGPPKQLPVSCAEYRTLIAKLPACANVASEERAALALGYQEASASWLSRDMSRMPASTLRAIDVACTRGRDAVRATIAHGCGDAEDDLFGGNRALPHECLEYRGMIMKLASCEAIPQASRDALRQGFESMSNAWVDLDRLSPEARKAMADACGQARDALRQAANASCGL